MKKKTGVKEVLRYEGAAIHHLIKSEIATLREEQQSLKNQGRTGTITTTLLFFSVIVNITVFLLIPMYISLFITASFYLYMIYFITLLIPIGGGTARFFPEKTRAFFRTLYRTGIITTSDRLARIFMDAFFINSRALCSGFVIVFSLDVVYALAGFIDGMFDSHALFVILFQAVAILIFYFLLWRLEPGSTRFQQEIREIRGAFTGRWYPSWVITLLFGTAALLVLLIIVTTIILLPGMTVQTFLSLSGLMHFENFFFFTGVLLVSQYIIVRFFHGIASADMAVRFADARISSLRSVEREENLAGVKGGSESESHDDLSEKEMRDATSALLESRIYRLDLKTLWGAFPVYLINLDFSIVFDEQVMNAITGYLKGAGAIGTEEKS